MRKGVCQWNKVKEDSLSFPNNFESFILGLESSVHGKNEHITKFKFNTVAKYLFDYVQGTMFHGPQFLPL